MLSFTDCPPPAFPPCRHIMARLLAAVILLLLPMLACAVSSLSEYGPSISATFYSEPFTMSPGQAQKIWFPIDFPTGHFGIRRLKAELVDENHEAVPLYVLTTPAWPTSSCF